MDIEGRFANLNVNETAETRIESPFELSRENIDSLNRQINEESVDLQKLKCASDELSHSDMCVIHEAEILLERRRKMALRLSAETRILDFADSMEGITPQQFLDQTRG